MSCPLHRLLVFADATPHMGTGHVVRSLALLQAARQQAWEGCLSTRARVPWVLELLNQKGIPFIERNEEIPKQENPESVLKVLRDYAPEWVVFDGYHFDLDCQQAVRNAGYKLLIIDDYAHLPEYSCEILLNQNISSETLSYTGDIGKKLLGPQYALLRSEFAAVRSLAEQRSFPAKAKNLLLTLGGGDSSVHLEGIAPLLCLPDFADCKLSVISGATPEGHIRSLLKNCPATVEVLKRVDDMPALLLHTDLCITAGGSTCWELCCLGVPFLTVEIAENQAEIVAGLALQKIAPPFDRQNLLNLFCSAKLRQQLSLYGRTLVSGHGCVEAIAQLG